MISTIPGWTICQYVRRLLSFNYGALKSVERHALPFQMQASSDCWTYKRLLSFIDVGKCLRGVQLPSYISERGVFIRQWETAGYLNGVKWCLTIYVSSSASTGHWVSMTKIYCRLLRGQRDLKTINSEKYIFQLLVFWLQKFFSTFW